jgi:5-carboxymethyl-2-hydroxymuconate isomerase
MRTVRLDGDEAVEVSLADRDGCEEMVREVTPARRWRFDPASLVAPVRPGKIIAVGLNYRDHAQESGMALPERPLLFAKLPSSVVGPHDDIHLLPEVTQLDYEGELGVVIGRRARSIPREHAWDHVLGLTVANDVSARDAQFVDGQWTRGKSFDTFCPLGPWVRTLDEVPDPQALPITTRVNGEVRQASDTGQLIFSVPDLLAYCSRYFTLEPGDVLLTGTPAGVGLGRTPPTYLRSGDVVEVDIAGVGRIRNTVRAVGGRS